MSAQPSLASAREAEPFVSPAAAGGRALVVCDQWLGSNGYAGMKALRRAGWSVQVVPEWNFIPLRWQSAIGRAVARALRPLGVREFNAELLRQAEQIEPELILVFKGSFVRPETLRALSARGIASYCFFPDVSFRVHGKLLPRALPAYDWIFTTKSFGLRDMREQLGVERASLLLHAFDPDLHRPVTLSAADRSRYECDASFIGTWSPKKERLLTALAQSRPALRIRVWGDQWDRVPKGSALQPALGGHALIGDDYARAVCASTINLGILSEQRAGASEGDQITSRTFHIPACGAFMLHERSAEVASLLRENEEIGMFSTPEELIASVDRWLAPGSGREGAARRAHDRVWTQHSWDHRIQVILAHHASRRSASGQVR
jgi:spore maturation protein CgeB